MEKPSVITTRVYFCDVITKKKILFESENISVLIFLFGSKMCLQNSDVDCKSVLQKKERGKGERRRGKAELEENEVFSEIVERGKRVGEMFFNHVERGDFTEHAEGIC